MRFLAALPWCVILAACTVDAGAPRWELAWQDDFDRLDEATWNVISSTDPTNNSLHAYLPEQVTVEDGRLVLTAVDEPYEGLAYRSGQVISKAEQRLGRWEVRAKLPTSRGQWPAIWLLPDVAKHPWPSGGEIDILENRGDQPRLTSSAFHYGTRSPYRHDFRMREQRTAVAGQLADYHAEFHTYAADWTDHQIRFYVDDVCHFVLNDADVGGFLSRDAKPMQLVINNAIGGKFLDDPDETSRWPQRMEIDSVRAYRLADEDAAVGLRNGDFDEGGGSLAGWSLFGTDMVRIQNAQPAREAVADGAASLKLFGTFGNGARYSGVQQGVTVSGGDPIEVTLDAHVRSADPLAGENLVLLKVDFYDRYGGRYGTEEQLGENEALVADATTPTDAWCPVRLRAVAPAGAVEARIGLVFDQPADAGGAAHLDNVEVTVRGKKPGGAANTR